MKRTPLLTALAAFLLLMAGCKNKNTYGLFIPKEAAIVFHINASSLSSKLSWDEIKKTQWYKDAYQESKDSLAQRLLDDPAASGIDTKGDFAFFLQRRGRGGFTVFEGNIKDASAFETLSKKISKQEKTEKDGEWNFLITDKNTSVVAWNKEHFAIISDMPEAGRMNPMGNRMGEGTELGADSLKAIVKEVMTVKGDKSLFDDDRFASLLKEDGDMHFWMNAGAFYSDMAGMMSMMKIGSLFEGNVSAATINFADGKITMQSKQYFGKEMQKLMAKFDSRNIDRAVLDRIPSENVIGVMAANFDPEILKEFFKSMGLDGMVNMMMAQENITLDEILSATKGQFVLAVSDLQMKDTTLRFETDPGEKPFTYTTRKPDMNFLFATSVNKKASFDKLLNVVADKTTNLPFSYKLNDEWFAASNKSFTADAFLAGKTTQHPFADKISGHPFGLYLDIQRLLKTNFSENAETKSYLSEAAAIWQDLVATGGEYKNGTVTSEIVVNMVDTKTNSLKQLNQFIEKMNAIKKANKVAYEDNFNMDMENGDSVVTAPVTTSPK